MKRDDRLTSLLWMVVIAVIAVAPVRGQMESPLKGQGTPSPNITKVFLSIRLERLLEVDSYHFRHETVATFWLTWRDSEAEALILRTTEISQAANETEQSCKRPCSNKVASFRCCDSIWLPSLYFSNAFAFPEDREIGSTIDTTYDGAVVWESTVHAIYFQPMSLRNFPYEARDLEMHLTLVDTWSAVPGHPGVKLVPSAVSLEGYHLSAARADLTSEWQVKDSGNLFLYNMNRTGWYQDRMLIPANAEDPAPFNALNATANGILSAQSQMAVFRFQVWRLGTEWRSVIPVLAVAGMCSLVFCIPEEDLTPRLEVVAALFLTLVAFAFSMGEPAAFVQTYVPPALQLLQITGLYLLLAAFESVTVFHIANRARFRERRKAMREANKDFWKHRRAAKTAVGCNGQADDDETITKTDLAVDETIAGDDKSDGNGDGSSAASEGTPQQACDGDGKKKWTCKPTTCCGGSSKRNQIAPPPAPDMYWKYVASVFNMTAFILMFVSYLSIAIFVLASHGSRIDLTNGWMRKPDAFVSQERIAGGDLAGVTVITNSSLATATY